MTLYRRIIWYFKGSREYTKSGYETASKSFKENDLEAKCDGKEFLITGANSGIGKSLALEIAKRGGSVHMVCRNSKTAEEARDEIVKETGNNNIHVHHLDISEGRKVIEFARLFCETHDQLNVLINNAGCMINTRELTPEGLEKNFATNTVGTYLLTTNLLPLLQKTPNSRVIIVSSGGMLMQKLNTKDLQFENLKPFLGTVAYSQNKRQQVIMTEQYAKKYPNIHFSSMHPGWADTPAVRSSMPEFYEKMKDKLRTPNQGADTALWLAISPVVSELSSGLFFQDRKAVSTHLTLAQTQSTQIEDEEFMTMLDELSKQFNP